MMNRRQFCRALAGATAAGSFLLPRSRMEAAGQTATGARRQVTIGGKRVKVVDVHCHCIIPEAADVVRGTALAKAAAGGANQILGPDRLRIMDQQGVDVEALTINGFWWYAADRDLARRIVDVQNQGLARWVAAHPDRFVAMASVALQYPELAADQLEEGMERFGLRGASIGGHVNGEDLSLPKYAPFWAKAAELGALVVMHPGGAENIVREGALEGRGNLGNIIGNPLETTYFLSRLIFDGTLDRFPGLKVCAVHAGGYLPSYLGRTEVACAVRANASCANEKTPREYLRNQIVVDTMVFSEEGLRHLVAEVGIRQVMYGTDVPFNWPATVDLILNAPFLNDGEKQAVLSGNALRLLKIAS
jgi:aminocarboxymuconate-semialdehyde decarboxylase